MVAVPEIQTEALKWQRRINMLTSAGLNAAPVQELARTDLTRLVQGGSPLPEDQITSMVYGAYTGQAQVSQQPSQNKADNNPFHWIGNAVKDIGTDVRSFPEGIVHEVADVINPGKWAQIPGDLAKVASDFPNISKAAKDFGLTPIVGPLVPGTFALSAGWSGFTKHPTNFLLDVLPFADSVGKVASLGVDVAAEDVAHSAMSSLKAGHPFQALMRATGAEQKLTDALVHSGTPAAEYALQPIWRRYNMLARTYSNVLVKNAMDELVSAGIVKKGMKLDDRVALTQKALHYEPRYETLATQLPPERITNDFRQSFGSIPAGTDVRAWQTALDSPVPGGGALDTSSPVYFSQEAAQQSLDPAVRDSIDVASVRVPVDSLSFQNGVWQGTNIIPWGDKVGKEIHYTPADRKLLLKVKDFTERYRSIDKVSQTVDESRRHTGKYQSVLMKDPNGNDIGYYAKDSRQYQQLLSLQEDVAKAATERDAKNLIHDKAARDVQHQDEIVSRLSQKRYRWFGDNEATASKRPPTVSSIEALGQSAEPFILQALKEQNLPVVVKDTINKLDDGFKEKDLPKIRAATAKLRVQLRGNTLYMDYVNYLNSELKGLGVQDSIVRSARAKLARLKSKESDALHNLTVAEGGIADKTTQFMDAMNAAPPSSAMPLIAEQARGRAVQQATRDYVKRAKELQGPSIATALDELRTTYENQISLIKEAKSKEELISAISGEDAAKSFHKVEQLAMNDWAQMVQAGYQPMWVHNIDVNWKERSVFGSIRPSMWGNYKAKTEVDQLLKDAYAPRELDIGVALTATAFEYLRAESTKQFTDFLINESGYVRKLDQMKAELLKRHKHWTPEQVDQEIKDNYVLFKPSEYVPGADPNAEYVMPAVAKEGFDRLERGNRAPFKKVSDPLMRVFKVSVLSGPRHLTHVMFGGLVMQTLRDPGAVLTELTHPMEVWKMARTGELPPELANLTNRDWFRENILQGNYEQTIDKMMQVRAGKKVAEWFQEGLAEGELSPIVENPLLKGPENVLRALNNIENTTTDMYRAATFLHDVTSHRGNYASVEAAMQHVHKIFIDVDNLTPFEQLTVRNIFPFWTFTKHIMRYVLTLPADAPIRAAILARLAGQVEAQGKGWTDPLRLQRLFFLGAPDAKGNVQTMDMSNLNPFRSMGSVFTMAGFLSGLNPEFQTALKMVGINSLTGTPSLHTNFSYNAYTGSRSPTRPNLSPFDWVSSFVPEVEVADHFLLFTDTMRQLKKTNPEAYARSFWQEINFPFALAPINIYDIRAKSAQGQFLDAQQAVADAMRTGNTDAIRTFDAVPFQGRLYDANQVANYIEYFDQLFPGLAPRATIKKPRVIRTKAVLPQL